MFLHIYLLKEDPISRWLEIESIWIELQYPRSRPCLFSSIYRPPSAASSFFEHLDRMLTKVYCNSYNTYLLGDYNIDIFSNNALKKRFINLTGSCNLHQLITVPINQSVYLVL